MRKYQWRELLQYNTKTNEFYANNFTTTSKKSHIPRRLNRWAIIKLVSDFYGKKHIKTNEKIERGDALWGTDQNITGILINEYAKQKRYDLEKRNYSGIRLDRLFEFKHWLKLVNTQFEELTDAHGYHELAFLNIDVVRALNRKLFNQSLNHLFDKYFNEYINLRMEFVKYTIWQKFDYYYYLILNYLFPIF
jgi:hypothetical protein